MNIKYRNNLSISPPIFLMMSKNSNYLIFSLIFIFAIIVLANHVYSQVGVSPSTQSLKTYQSPLFGYQFQYPTDFPKIEESSNGAGFLFNETEAALALNAITIVVNDLSEPTTLQKYLRKYLAGTSGVKYDTLVVNQTIITSEKIPAVRAEYQLVLVI